MDRILDIQQVEGEIALTIDYRPGQTEALSVLSGAMRLIESLDRLDHCLLSSIDTTLEPVSILNDVQHSSLKTELGDIHLPLLAAPPTAAPLVEEALSSCLLQDQVLIIESAVFKDGNQWRFSDGSASFSAAIMDSDFLARVDAGERFGKGDHLVVDLEIEQSRLGNKLTARRSIRHVKAHKDRALQLILL